MGCFFHLCKANNLVSVRTEDALNLIQRIINPIGDFIGSRLVGQDIRADKVLDRIRAAVCAGQDVVDVPTAVNGLTVPPNKIVGVTIGGATHKVAVKVLGKFDVPKEFIP